MTPQSRNVLCAIAFLLVPVLAQAEPVSFEGAWGKCTFTYPGHVSVSKYPECTGIDTNTASCKIYATLDDVEHQWTATVRSHPLKSKFTGQDTIIPFGDGSLQCLVTSNKVTAIRKCWAKKAGTGGSGGCIICGPKDGVEQCAAVSVTIRQDKAQVRKAGQ